MQAQKALKKYMKRHGLTQKALGDRFGVSQSMVSQWLNGTRPVGADRAIEIETQTAGEVTKESLNALLGRLAKGK